MLKIKFNQTLKEIFVKGDRDADAICAYREHLWMFDEMDIPEDIQVEILDALNLDNISSVSDLDELKDILESKNKYDVLLGRIHTKIGGRSELEIIPVHPSFVKDPQSSLTVKKVVKALKIDKVSYSGLDDEYQDTPSREVSGEIPTVVYHGTTTKYLGSILKSGLSPGVSKTNYESVSHQDAVFFTSRLPEAAYHAEHAAMKNDGEPLVLIMRIPDKDKIIPDFDVDAHAEDEAYPNIYKRQDKSGSIKGKSMTHTKEFGLYGYRGRIPASFIDEFMVVPNFQDIAGKDTVKTSDFQTINKEQAKRYVYNKENFDIPTWDEIDDEES